MLQHCFLPSTTKPTDSPRGENGETAQAPHLAMEIFSVFTLTSYDGSRGSSLAESPALTMPGLYEKLPWRSRSFSSCDSTSMYTCCTGWRTRGDRAEWAKERCIHQRALSRSRHRKASLAPGAQARGVESWAHPQVASEPAVLVARLAPGQPLADRPSVFPSGARVQT